MECSKWCNLPSDTLALIAKRPNLNQMDIRRLRAVCSSWRSSLPCPKMNCPVFPLQLPFPIEPAELHSDMHCPLILTQRTIFILSPLQDPDTNSPTPWIIQVEQTGPNKCSELPSCITLNLLDYNITEIHQSYHLEFGSSEINDEPMSQLMPFVVGSFNSRIKKAIVLPDRCIKNDHVIVLALYGHGELAFWRVVEAEQWIPLETHWVSFADIVCYRGDFYAVEKHGGRLVRIDLETRMLVEVVTKPLEVVWDYMVSYLLELDDKLYLVTFTEHYAGVPVISLRVYVLNEVNETWDRTYDLGGKVFVVATGIVFSVSAKDLGLPEGNVLYFCNSMCYNREEDREIPCSLVCDLYSNSTLVHKFWPNREPFWPPPRWIMEAE